MVPLTVLGVVVPAPSAMADAGPFTGTPARVLIAQAVNPGDYAAGSAQAAIVQACPVDPDTGRRTATQLYNAVQQVDSTGAVAISFVPVGNPTCVRYNAIGFDPVDGYVYGIVTIANAAAGAKLNDVVRVDMSGAVTAFWSVGLTPANNPYTIGTFGTLSTGANVMFVAVGQGAGTRLVCTIPFTGGSTTAADTPGTATCNQVKTGTGFGGGAPTYLPNIADWIFRDGYLWGFSTNAGNTGAINYLYRIDPVTWVMDRVKLPAGFNNIGLNSFGGQWLYGNGNIGLSDNNTGLVYQVRFTNPDGSPWTAGPTMPVVVFVGTPVKGPSSQGNDGTATPGQFVDMGVVKQVSDDLTTYAAEAVFTSGDTVGYSLRISNDTVDNTLAISSGWTVTDPIPAGLTGVTVVSVTPSGTATASCTVTTATGTPPNAVVCVGAAGLAPGQSVTVMLTGTASGTTKIANTATVIGLDHDPNPANDTSTATLTPAALNFTKSVSPKALSAPGSVTYTYVVSNDGSATMYAVHLTSDMVTTTAPDGAVGTPVPVDLTKLTCTFVGGTGSTLTTANVGGFLTPAGVDMVHGDQITCTYTRTFDQLALDRLGAGTTLIDNTASVDSMVDTTTPGPTLTDTAEVTVDLTPGLSVTKTAAPAIVTAPGKVTYTISVWNTGNMTLTGVTVSDPGPAGGAGMSDLTCDNGKTGPSPLDVGDLAVGPTPVVCQATYDVTADDIAAGTALDNTVSVTADQETTPKTDTATVDVAGLTVAKVASPAVMTAPGTVMYTFTVKNVGSVTLTNVTVTDPGPVGGTGVMTPAGEICVIDTLDAGKSQECTATYTVTAADIAAGKALVNTATASGTDPDGGTVKAPDATATVNVTGLTLAKVASPTVMTAPGTVTYTFTVENVGSVDLTGVTVTDPGPVGGASAMVPAGTVCTIATLPVGKSQECTATYAVTAADIAAGKALVNTATAAGTDPDGGTVKAPDATATVDVAGLALTKTASVAQVVAAGDQVTYSFTVTNTGSAPLHQVTVSDPKPAGWAGTMSPTGAVPCVGTLAAGATATCTGTFTYTVAQADIDAGTALVNTATATGLDPTEKPLTATNTATVAVLKPSLALTKTVAGPNPAKAGDKLTFTFTVVNGPVALHDVTVVDDQFSGTGPAPAVATCTIGGVAVDNAAGFAMAAGATAVCTSAPYTVMQADVDLGKDLANHATATGTPVDPATRVTPVPPLKGQDDVTAPLKRDAAITVVKTVDKATASVGDLLTYTFQVTNTGTTTLDWTYVDSLASATWSPALVTCRPADGLAKPVTPGEVMRLGPGATVYCQVAPYKVTALDAAAKQVVNTVIVTGTPLWPDATPVPSAPSTAKTVVTPVQILSGGASEPGPGAGGFLAMVLLVGAAVLGAGLIAERREQRA